MKKYIEIPLSKNKGINPEAKPKTTTSRRFRWVLLAVGIMMFYVWLKLATNAALVRIAVLQTQIEEQQIENEKLQAEVTTLSSIENIQKTAQALGLDFIPHENIIRISPAP